MDDDSLRRGRPTNHVVHGEGMAILAGDGLLTEAFALMAAEPRDPALAARKIRTIRTVAVAAGACGMVGGQAIDLLAVGAATTFTATVAAGHARAKDRRAHSCGGGRRRHHGRRHRRGDPRRRGIRPAPRACLSNRRRHPRRRGRAKDLGKTVGKDAKAGKPTYPSIYGLDASRRLAADRHDSALARWRPPACRTAAWRDIASWVIHATTIESQTRRAARRSRPGAVARAGGRADPVRRRAGQRPARAESRDAGVGQTRRSPSRSRTTPTSDAAESSWRMRSRHSACRSPAAKRSTSAPRPADSPMCFSSAAQPAWSLSTSATASSTGVCGTIPALSSSSERTRAARAATTSRSGRHRHDRRVVHLAPPHLSSRAAAAAPWRRRRRARQAAVRSGPRERSARKASCAIRPFTRASSRRSSRAAAEVGLVRAAMTESPITGDTGNREFFLHLRGRAVMQRVGIVAKARLERAASHLAQIASWLEATKHPAGL